MGISEGASTSHLEENYICVECGAALLKKGSQLQCIQCDAAFDVIENIPVFSKKRGYWCTIGKEKMHQLIQDAETSGDWLSAVNKHIKPYAAHVVPMYRADAQFAFPINKASRVLDAGSMWGGLTIPISQFAGSVYAVDQTWETLRFLKVRSQQMGLNNITLVESSIHKLPFPDNYFDFVVLNGVLEWLGVEQEIVLEKHWKNKREDKHSYGTSPRSMQLAALKELFRVTKPGGGIYVAIENRWGLQYFLGHPDDHVNVRFVTFMPRFLANAVTKICRNSDYRTYIYSPKKLQQLVNQSGFNCQHFYTVYPHYGKISRMVPLTLFKAFKRLAKQGYTHMKIFFLSSAWNMIPEPLGKYMSPSVSLLASKEQFTLPQRLTQILANQGIIKPSEMSQFQLILVNNRFGNGHTTNYIVYDTEKKRSLYFCKICRVRDLSSLHYESKQLATIKERVAHTKLVQTIPNLLYFGTVDGVTLQVATYVEAKPISQYFLNALRNVPRFIKPSNKVLLNIIALTQKFGRKRWLKAIHPMMNQSIAWLVDFQRATKASQVFTSHIVEEWIPSQLAAIEQKHFSAVKNKQHIDILLQQLGSYANLEVPIVMQHGDFDICNVLKTTRGIFVVDFEHAESSKLPFFDLANLIFSPLISEWKIANCSPTLAEYVKVTPWGDYINKWLKTYADQSNMPKDFIKLAMKLAVLEQNAKTYPDTRNPYDYPMYGQEALDAMLSLEL